jgi:hypothetical protein
MLLTKKQAGWIKNGCILVILADVFSGFADEHNVIGLCIAVPAALLTVYIMFTYFKQEPEPELEQENPHYLTVSELIDRLELIEDPTNVVVDSSGYPITSISNMADEDFGCATWLRGFPASRKLYKDSKGEKNG